MMMMMVDSDITAGVNEVRTTDPGHMVGPWPV